MWASTHIWPTRSSVALLPTHPLTHPSIAYPHPPCLPPASLPPSLRRGPTIQEVLDEGEYELQQLPSDEAWFGEPDPAKYAPGTNDLTRDQLAEEVAKGNVCTLRQLKQHLTTATDEELAVSSLAPTTVGAVPC